MPARLNLRLIGPPSVERGRTKVSFDTRKAVALLAVLAVRGEPQSRDSIAALLWPDYDAAHAAGALRRTLSVTRAAVGPEALQVEGRMLALAPRTWSDVARLHETAGIVDRHHRDGSAICDGCLVRLAELPHLARGPFLEGFGLRDSAEFDDWMATTAEDVALALAGGLDRLADALGARGQHAAAIAAARRRLIIDPLHEGTYRRLIALHAARGDRSAALLAYRDCVRVLDEELGVAPMPETTELYQRITAGDARTSPAPDQGPAGAGSGEEMPLVGRRAEMDALASAWRRSATSGGWIVLLEGEPGIGKSRLLAELDSEARQAGAAVLSLTAHEGEQPIPYAPILDSLTRAATDPGTATRIGTLPGWVRGELGRLVPGLPGTGASDAPPAIEGPGAEIRFIDALSRTLQAAVAGPQPGLLLVDDAQWLDAATLAVLGYAARRIGEASACLVIARRSTEPDDDRLAELLRDARRRGRLVEVRPARLSVADVARLGQASAGLDPGRLFDETEGIPFFIAEYLAAASELSRLEAGAATPLPIRELLAARIARLGATARQVIVAAAVIGRSFDLELVQSTSGRSATETAAALDELLGRGLVRESVAPDGTLTYDFDHAKTRDVSLGSASLARRRLLHGRAARALERRDGARPAGNGEAAMIGRHLREAGDDLGASRYLRRAADEAASIHANAEALELSRAALALDATQATEIHERIGELATRLGRYDEAVAAYEAAIAGLPADGDRWRVEHRLASVHARRGDWPLAEAHLAAAGDALTAPMTPERARITADLSLAAHRRGQPRRAARLAAEALALAEAADDPACRAQAHNLLGILARAAGHARQARTQLERSLELAQAAGLEDARIASLNNLALLARAEGDEQSALSLAREALDAATTIGDLHREAALRNNLADALHAAGQHEAALSELKRSVALFAEIGRPGAMEPEIWKLVEW